MGKIDIALFALMPLLSAGSASVCVAPAPFIRESCMTLFRVTNEIDHTPVLRSLVRPYRVGQSSPAGPRTGPSVSPIDVVVFGSLARDWSAAWGNLERQLGLVDHLREFALRRPKAYIDTLLSGYESNLVEKRKAAVAEIAERLRAQREAAIAEVGRIEALVATMKTEMDSAIAHFETRFRVISEFVVQFKTPSLPPFPFIPPVAYTANAFMGLLNQLAFVAPAAVPATVAEVTRWVAMTASSSYFEPSHKWALFAAGYDRFLDKARFDSGLAVRRSGIERALGSLQTTKLRQALLTVQLASVEAEQIRATQSSL